MQQETPKMIGDFLVSPFGCHAIARQYIMSLRVLAIEQPDNPVTKLITDHSSHALSVAVNHSDGEGNFC